MQNNLNFKTIIFDLDGTLLPMDLDEFLKYYFKLISLDFKDYDVGLFIGALQASVQAMLNNDGASSNEVVFWDKFLNLFSGGDELEAKFEDFYKNEFQTLQKYTPQDPDVVKIIQILKEKNYQLICCTNPVFPKIATYSRLNWAGLSPDDFIEVTTYENSSFCKPNLQYYKEVLERFNIKATDCLMVGNDVDEDMITKELGMQTYLVSNHIINKNNKPIDADYVGTREELLSFVAKLKTIKIY